MFYLSVRWAYSNHDCMQRKTAALLKLLHIPLKLVDIPGSNPFICLTVICQITLSSAFAGSSFNALPCIKISLTLYQPITQLFHLSLLNHMVFVHYITAGLFLCAGLLRNWLFSFSSKFPILILCLSNRPEEWHRYPHLIVAKKEKKKSTLFNMSKCSFK